MTTKIFLVYLSKKLHDLAKIEQLLSSSQKLSVVLIPNTSRGWGEVHQEENHRFSVKSITACSRLHNSRLALERVKVEGAILR